ncbi:hypothetical protein AAHA92_08350 [Salvia divinorum]|uniref:WRKY19-like zinc finger domain-containing protein n=1 Tax=Salvia divinorum TaxID=28513 RepID=A0ABD1HP52_SALDI
MYPSVSRDFTRVGNAGDTTLRLNGFGYGAREAVTIGNSQTSNGVQVAAPDDGCKLVLGLGPTPSAYSDEYSPSGGNKSGEMLSQSLSFQRDLMLKLGLCSGPDAVKNVLEFSASNHSPRDAMHHIPLDGNRFAVPIVDEGSTSAKKSGGYMTQLILAPRAENTEILRSTSKSLEHGAQSHHQTSQMTTSEPSGISSYSLSAISEPGNAAVSSNSRGSNMKRCKFSGCTKGARGATGLCIGHGGGQRCQKPGCNKGAESRTAYCKAHGGGRRCEHLGCTKSAEGNTDHCIAHGGGRRCSHPGGCTKAARGKSGLCIRHGGGKRCKIEGCARSAEGKVGLCISHGGGRRCHFLGCAKGAQGSTVFCKAHGGGKRCVFAGCNKGAEGNTPLCKGHGGGKRCMFDGGSICPKSVHGGTNFCVAHGGGKRCAVAGCTKSARGRTDCCVKHGGGKRCKFENCDKSAQGSTDFCKAHGGGKRCSWGDGKCEKFARGRSGLCAAHTSLSLSMLETNGGGMLGPGLFHGLVHASGSKFDKACSSSGVSSLDSLEKPAKWQPLIPPQVLVPLSMKAKPAEQPERSSGDGKSVDLVGPEGRVHGGGLLSLLGGNLSNAI